MHSLSTKTEIENDSQDYDISSLNHFFTFKEKFDNYEFEKAFSTHFNNKESLNKLNDNIENDYNIENMINLKQKKEKKSFQILDKPDNNTINLNNNNENNLLCKKIQRDNRKFKVNKINPKREIAFITFNTKFNKYLTEKINKKISEIHRVSKFFFTDENPLLSTKFTQCGIQKTLKEYLNRPIKDFIKKENLNKIKEFGLGNDSLFNSLIYECIYEYYEFIYSNKNEFNKYLLDQKFVIRNEKFSKDGLINLKYEQNSKKIYGYLDFFKIDINLIHNKGKNNRLKFNTFIKE